MGPGPENDYARLFETQGTCVIALNEISWYDYRGCMVPAFLPHCVPAIGIRMSGRYSVGRAGSWPGGLTGSDG